MRLEEEQVDNEQDYRRQLHPDRLPFLPPLIAAAIRLLHRSCKFTILGKEHEDAAWISRSPTLMACWHFAFPAVIYRFRDIKALVMVSRSRDGEWAARVVQQLGYRCFRGSPGKGGSNALKQLISYVHRARGAGLIADGSQGPPRIAQKGILLLARYSGAPLLPVSMAARPCWRFHSWDRTVLAMPFSRIVLAFGAPMRIRRDISAEELEDARLQLETTLNRLTTQAEEAL
jgi:lysophospholipid acyltransferase (LPLAT)-like uncharacterized protein